LSSYQEINSKKWMNGYDDNWPVERTSAIAV
jgi:hypothetical protein